MHFEKHSPYLCEAFHVMATEPPPQANSLDWGAYLYQKVYRRLLGAGVRPFAVLPWCFTDPRNCGSHNRIPDPFEPDPTTWQGLNWTSAAGTGAAPTDHVQVTGRHGKAELEKRLDQIWSIHLHNQWNKTYPLDGWVQDLLNKQQVDLQRHKREWEASGRLVPLPGRS